MTKPPIGPTLTYSWAEKLIRNLCWWFHTRHRHLPFDDLVAEANWAFVAAYHSHDDAKGDFEPWLKLKVVKGLYELLETEARHRSRFVNSSDIDLCGPEPIPHEPAAFDPKTEPDACLVVKTAVAELHADGNKDPYLIRADVMRTLRKRGWSRWRRDRAFRAVGDRLRESANAD